MKVHVTVNYSKAEFEAEYTNVDNLQHLYEEIMENNVSATSIVFVIIP